MAPVESIQSSQKFWTCLITIPRVKASMQEALLVHEIEKRVPEKIKQSSVRWECLDELASEQPSSQSCFFVQFPLQESTQLSSLQALIKYARQRKKCYYACLLLGKEVSELLILDAPQEFRFLSPKETKVFLEEKKEKSFLILSESGNSIQAPNPRELKHSYIQGSVLLRQNSSQFRDFGAVGKKFWIRVLWLSMSLLVLNQGIFFYLLNKKNVQDLNGLKQAILHQQERIQGAQEFQNEFEELKQTLEDLRKKIPFNFYSFLEKNLSFMSPEDKILSVIWEGESKTMTFHIISRNPLKLLQELEAKEVFASFTSSTMQTFNQDERYFLFTLKGQIL